jgi:hypothetical protein
MLGPGVVRPRWARAEIATLDPRSDARRITQLSFEARVRSPLLIHAMFSLAFARQVAVPEIAEILYRDGRGLIMRDPRKRNAETLVRFGELFHHGVDDGDTIDRISRAHRPYPITNDLNLYTLATLACEPRRVSRRLLGRDFFSDREVQAHHTFWRQVGEALGITGIPAGPDEFMAFFEDFEQRRYAPTVAGRAVTDTLADEFAARWFPRNAADPARNAFFALFDERLLATHGVRTDRCAPLVRAGIRGYLNALVVLPDGRPLNVAEYFRADSADPASAPAARRGRR